jgi:hypothetical protein
MVVVGQMSEDNSTDAELLDTTSRTRGDGTSLADTDEARISWEGMQLLSSDLAELMG